MSDKKGDVQLTSRYNLVLDRAIQIEGWMSGLELLWLAYQAHKAKSICEVGSWKGRSTRALLDNTEGPVLAVDTWAGSDEEDHEKELAGKDPDWLFDEFIGNVSYGTPDGKLLYYRGLSLDGAKFCKDKGLTFDFIFIDASHKYEDVKADIKAWMPLVNKGGLLAGHDYSHVWPSVVKAVDELLPHAVNVIDDIWATRFGSLE